MGVPSDDALGGNVEEAGRHATAPCLARLWFVIDHPRQRHDHDAPYQEEPGEVELRPCANWEGREMPKRYGDYVLSKIEVTPSGVEWRKHDHASITASIGSEWFRRRLSATKEFVDEHFQKCTVVVGDYLSRITLQIESKGLDEAEAISKSVTLGEEFVSQEFPDSLGKFRIVRSLDLQQTESYRSLHAEVRYLFGRSSAFADAVMVDVDNFVSRRRRVLLDSTVYDTEHARAQCREYVLEELAIYADLVDRGCGVDVYPQGDLHTLTQAACGLLPEAPEQLRRRINLALILKGKKKARLIQPSTKF